MCVKRYIIDLGANCLVLVFINGNFIFILFYYYFFNDTLVSSGQFYLEEGETVLTRGNFFRARRKSQQGNWSQKRQPA